MQVGYGGGRKTCGREDCTCVVTQYPEPGRHICGVIWTRIVGDAKIGTQERSAKLSDQFLGSICRIPKPLPECPAKPVLRAGPVDQFVQKGGIVAFGGG